MVKRKKEEDLCEACNGEMISYWTDGVYGACLMCCCIDCKKLDKECICNKDNCEMAQCEGVGLPSRPSESGERLENSVLRTQYSELRAIEDKREGLVEALYKVDKERDSKLAQIVEYYKKEFDVGLKSQIS